eukprot:5223160-Prymnesium_polylepis.1
MAGRVARRHLAASARVDAAAMAAARRRADVAASQVPVAAGVLVSVLWQRVGDAVGQRVPRRLEVVAELGECVGVDGAEVPLQLKVDRVVAEGVSHRDGELLHPHEDQADRRVHGERHGPLNHPHQAVAEQEEH